MNVDIATYRARIGQSRCLSSPSKAKPAGSCQPHCSCVVHLLLHSLSKLPNSLASGFFHFASFIPICLLICSLLILSANSPLRKRRLYFSTSTLRSLLLDSILICSYVSLVNRALLIQSGSVDVNLGPLTSKFCFATWNVDSLLANQKDTKKDYIESIDSVHKFDIFGICESYLRGSIPPEKLNIQGFAEPLRADSKATGRARGGVSLYYKEHLPLRRREDLEILDELIVVEISLNRKKILLALTYRSPSQSPDQFNEWMAKLESLNDKIMAEKPDSIIFTGDFNVPLTLLLGWRSQANH